MDLPGRVPGAEPDLGHLKTPWAFGPCTPWTVKKERLVGLLLFPVLISPALQLHRKGAKACVSSPAA